MRIINTCESCGAEQPSWMGGSHLERKTWQGELGCWDADHKKRWYQHYLPDRVAYIVANPL